MFLIRRSLINRFFLIPKIRLEDLFLLKKENLARWIFYVGILIVYYTSLTPWFLWRFYSIYQVLACFPIIVAILFSRGLSTPLFTRKDYIYPLAAYCVLLVVTALVNSKNVNGYILIVFNAIIFFSLFRVNVLEVRRIGAFLAKTMACLLSVSIPFYILYLLRFPLPHYHIVPSDFNYAFENYYFFLIDDRATLQIIPRFHSVFLEPAHLGMACIVLLFSQIGQWNRWYNIVLFVAVILTFSLAAYVFLVILFFSASWMKGKSILGKIFILTAVCAFIAIAAMYYNKGENMVNQLIVQRLVVNEEGKIEGDNRVSGMFEKEYNQMASTSEILVGRGSESMKRFKYEGGNAGFRVYIYRDGLISVFFLLILLLLIANTSSNKRAKMVFLFVQFVSFIPHAMPLRFYFFIPLFVLLYSDVIPVKSVSIKNL